MVSRFIPTVSGGAAVLVLLSRGRCLLASVPSENGVMPFSSSVFSPAPCYHTVAAAWLARCSCLAHRRLLLVPGGIALASCRSFDLMRRDGRRDGWLLGYRGSARRGSAMSVYNEYDVCDVYKRYKDTRIRWIYMVMRAMAMSCATPGDETGRTRPDEQDPTGRYNEYGMYGHKPI